MAVRRSKDRSEPQAAAALVSEEAGERLRMLGEERRRLRLAAADSEAFGWFYERYGASILLFLRSMVPNHDDAQDLHDRVFVRALLSLERFQWRGMPYRAYLCRIAANEAAGYWRSRRGRQYVDADGDLPLPDPRANALSELIDAEEARRLREAIAVMSEPDQTVLRMYYWEERSTAQIAAELGAPRGTIQARLDRARDKLQRVLTREARPAVPAAAPEEPVRWLAKVWQRRFGLQRDQS